MIQPILVRPLPDGRFELIAGERRWRAAREAGLEIVPAMIRDEDAATRMQTALIENVAREDLNPVDEARACAALVEDLGLTKEELAPPARPHAASRSRTWSACSTCPTTSSSCSPRASSARATAARS